MRILFKQSLKDIFSCKIKEYLLWPAYEFEIPIKGYKNIEFNILEYTILQFININIIEEEEISKATGLETDLISFIKSRLYQKGYINNADRIEIAGKQYIEDLSKKEEENNITYINIYVDAITGKLIPYVKDIQNSDCFRNVNELKQVLDENKKGFTEFWNFSLNVSVGKDSDKIYRARELKENPEKNRLPNDLRLINEHVLKTIHKDKFIRSVCL